MEVISNCYQLDEDLFRQFVEKRMYATPVFLILKGINTGHKKCSQLVNTLKTNASNDFNNFTIKFDSDMKKSLKRNRSCLSPTKTGCTPKREKRRILLQIYMHLVPTEDDCSLLHQQQEGHNQRHSHRLVQE